MKIIYLPYSKKVSWSDRDTTEYDFYFPQGIEVKKAPPVRAMAERELAQKLGCPFEELPELLEESPELCKELQSLISKYKAQFPAPVQIVWVEVGIDQIDRFGLVKNNGLGLPQVGYCNLPSSPEAERIYKEREDSREDKLSFLSAAFEKVAEAAHLLGLTPKKPRLIYERGYASVTGSIEVEFYEDGKNFSVSYDQASFGGFLSPTLEAILQDLRKRKEKELEAYYAEKRRKEQLASFYENQRKSSLEKGEVVGLSGGVVVKLDADGCTVRVPDWAVPHLIGKGGQKIKAASQALGRRIKLESYPDQNKPRKAQAWWLI